MGLAMCIKTLSITILITIYYELGKYIRAVHRSHIAAWNPIHQNTIHQMPRHIKCQDIDNVFNLDFHGHFTEGNYNQPTVLPILKPDGRMMYKDIRDLGWCSIVEK